MLSDSRRYWEQKEALVRGEQLLLRALQRADMWPYHQSTGCPSGCCQEERVSSDSPAGPGVRHKHRSTAERSAAGVSECDAPERGSKLAAGFASGPTRRHPHLPSPGGRPVGRGSCSPHAHRRAASPLCELSCALLNDSSAQASLLTCSPNLLAASVIHLASSLLRTPIQARARRNTADMQTCRHAGRQARARTSRAAAPCRRQDGGWRSTSRRLPWSQPATSCSICTLRSRAKQVRCSARRRKALPRRAMLRSPQPTMHPAAALPRIV